MSDQKHEQGDPVHRRPVDEIRSLCEKLKQLGTKAGQIEEFSSAGRRLLHILLDLDKSLDDSLAMFEIYSLTCRFIDIPTASVLCLLILYFELVI